MSCAGCAEVVVLVVSFLVSGVRILMAGQVGVGLFDGQADAFWTLFAGQRLAEGHA